MKNLYFVLITVFLLTSCNRDDDNTNKVVGEWKLIKIEQTFFSEDSKMVSTTTDYSSKNITYNFQANNILKVSGDEEAEHLNGSHSYEFKKDNVGCIILEDKIDVVQIEDYNWIFNRSNSKMILSSEMSCVDGSDKKLIFERE